MFVTLKSDDGPQTIVKFQPGEWPSFAEYRAMNFNCSETTVLHNYFLKEVYDIVSTQG